MSNKRPQVTGVLISRLQRVARHHDSLYADTQDPADRARANVCWQAAARMEDLLSRLRGQDVARS